MSVGTLGRVLKGGHSRRRPRCHRQSRDDDPRVTTKVEKESTVRERRKEG